MDTTFYELAGEGAKETLQAFANLFATDQSQLLESTEEPGLFLLICQTDASQPPLKPPAGCKSWHFRTVD